MIQSANTQNQELRESTLAFTAWLERETQQLGWSFRDLARRSGLSAGALDEALANGTGPTWALCTHISRALRMSPLAVFRKGGLLPPQPESRAERLAEVLDTLALLPEGPIRDEALEAIQAVAQHAHHRTGRLDHG
jgi:transcriptional regulator with XRE-family HTH domain